VFRHTFRTWLDSVGTPVGVQQRLMRHADIRTTMNIYGDAFTSDMQNAHEKVVRLVLSRAWWISVDFRAWMYLKTWGGRRESNPQQPEPQSGALPVELLPPDLPII